MAAYSFREARQCVVNYARTASVQATEEVPLIAAFGRVLAEDVAVDRDSPPVARSIRDGFAVRAADLPGEFTVIGEARAGATFAASVGPREAVEIMTGAPVPTGADCVVMVEHTTRAGNRMRTERTASPGEFVNPRGAEARAGDTVAPAGRRISYPEVALLAATGKTRISVFVLPRVAIVPTGDEIVEVSEAPLDHQIRNSNAWSLAAQVTRAGGMPEILPIAPDTLEGTRALVERGLDADLLLLSGGVSAGKYDVVERVLADLGAEFYFDRVLIQPGQPLVFGRCRNRLFFGLPGNPASTMVTFEVFARAALDYMGGCDCSQLPFLWTRLDAPFRHQPGLTRFLPAKLASDGSSVTPIRWQGSSDVPALGRADAFLVVDPDRSSWNAGDWIQVLLK